MNTPIGPGPHSRRRRAWPAPPNRSDSLQPPNFQPLKATAAHVAEHRIQHPPKGIHTMLDRSQIDATVFRVAVAAFTYYPDKSNREPGYTLDEDLDWCMRPLRHLPQEERDQLRAQIVELITEQTADRQALIKHLKSLSSDT